MYNIIKNVILDKHFELSEMLRKIDIIWVQGDISDTQKKELGDLAVANATPIPPEAQKLYEMLKEEVDVLKEKVAKLENGGVAPQPPTAVVIPTWKAWDGISKDYVKGAVVEHKGKYWQSLHNGQNVWEPTASVPQLWKEITKQEAEQIVGKVA